MVLLLLLQFWVSNAGPCSPMAMCQSAYFFLKEGEEEGGEGGRKGGKEDEEEQQQQSDSRPGYLGVITLPAG